MGALRERSIGFVPWIALGMVWLLGIAVIVALLEPALTMLLGRRIIGSGSLTVCDVPNVCVWNGLEGTESYAPLPLDAVSRGAQILSAVPGILLAAVTIAVLVLGTRTVRGVSGGRAFAPGTVRDLGLAALLLLVSGVVTYILEERAFAVAMEDVSGSGLLGDTVGMYAGVRPMFPMAAVVFGVLVLAAWAAFREGARVTGELAQAREELDGVI